MPSHKSKSRNRSRKVRSQKSKSRGYTKLKCRSYLSRKIKANMKELKAGRWTSRQQALAVSFAQTAKKYPRCSRFLKRK